MKKINKYIDKIFKKFLKIKFVNENYKLTIKIILFISLFLIFKLFWLTWAIWFWASWWFISLNFVPQIWYLPSVNTIISVILIIIFYLIYKKFIKNKKTKKFIKLKYSVLILILSLFWRPLFNIIPSNIWFAFKKVENIYYDKKTWEFDVDKYLYYMIKFCNPNNDNKKYCDWKYEKDFNSVEDYIKVLKIADENNLKHVYSLAVLWLVDYSWFLEEVIEEYRNETFYAYIIKWNWTDITLLNQIKLITKNSNLIKIIDDIKNWLNDYELNEINMTSYEIGDFWEKYDKEIREKLRKINTINQKLF